MHGTEYRIGSLSSRAKRITSYMFEPKLLTEEWYLNVRRRTLVIWDSRSTYVTWKSAIQNHATLLQFIDNYCPDVSVAQEVHLLSSESQGATITLSQLITNCIVSFTIFLTVAKKNLPKENKYSSHLDLWNRKRNDLHAQNFSYRLGYELRNYSQHYEIPISEVVFTMENDSVIKLQAYVKSKNLLDGGYNWKRLKNEFAREENSAIDLVHLLQEYLRCINEIYINTLNVYLEQIKECRSFIGELCTKHKIDRGAHPVVFKGPIIDGSKPPREKNLFRYIYLIRCNATGLEN